MLILVSPDVWNQLAALFCQLCDSGHSDNYIKKLCKKTKGVFFHTHCILPSFCLSQLVRLRDSSDVEAVNASTVGTDVTVVLTVETAPMKSAVCTHIYLCEFTKFCCVR